MRRSWQWSGFIVRRSSSARPLPYVALVFGMTAYLLLRGTAVGALTRSCGSDSVANTANVLCASPSGPCNSTTVTLGASIDVTAAGCAFDVGGRNVTISKTLQMTGLGFIKIRNAAQITITSAGKLKARGDFVQPNGYIVPGGLIQLSASSGIVSAGVIDVSGDPGGTVQLTSTAGDVTLQSGSVLQGNGVTTFATDNDRFSDGGEIDIIASNGGITLGDAINATGTQHGQGGAVSLQAARAISINGAIDASGGESDGGSVDADAGDNMTITKSISVDSRGGGGFGGEITLIAGDDSLGGSAAGGSLTLNNTALQLSGSSLDGGGGDGGDLFAVAAGLLRMTGANVAIHANAGANYDGWGGTITFDTTDGDDGTIGVLDGDITLDAGVITAKSGDTAGEGGLIEMFAGKALALAASIDVTGHDSGGIVEGEAGGAIGLSAVISAQATTATGVGGSVEFDAGFAQDATLTVTQNIVAASGSSSIGLPSISLSSCSLSVGSGTRLDARTGTGAPGGNAVIQLIARHPMQLNASSQYLANPQGLIQTIHPVGQNPVIGTGVVFNPSRSDQVIASGVYPPCPTITPTPSLTRTPTLTPTPTP